ncbi:hypothetical protein OQA88_60 [Cercophora sp. LCS_1]
MDPPPPPYTLLPPPPPPPPRGLPPRPDGGFSSARPPADPRNGAPLPFNVDPQSLRPPGRLRLQTSMPNLSSAGRFTTSPGPYSASPTPLDPPSTSTTPGGGSEKPFWQNALSETQHFMGGLIPHATESTKHYTILRHSAPLIFYRGPATSIEISILSAPKYPLPLDRALWLQQRGHSGDSGMKLKAMMGATSDWLDVTPAVQARTQDLAPNDERAWQRDIQKTARKLAKEKGEKGHIPRETHVVRIPAASSDGYFRLALCTGGGDAGPTGDAPARRKVLCYSPIFRVASTSTDSSVFRGASLSTMPLEIGVKVASVAANATVKKYTGPVVGIVQSGVDRFKPGVVVREAGRYAVGALRQDPSANAVSYVPETNPFFNNDQLTPIGPETGPEFPFPLKFSGKVVPGSGRSRAELGIPTANLNALSPDDIGHRLRGVYFGWTGIVPNDDSPPMWHQSIIACGPSPYARPTVVVENLVTVHLFHEFRFDFVNAKVRVIVMGFMRHMLDLSATLQQRLDMVSRDVLLTVASLNRGRECWGPEVTVQKLRTVKSARGLGERFNEAKDKVQRRVDSVPLHALGVRTAGHEERDGMFGRGGYWVRR